MTKRDEMVNEIVDDRRNFFRIDDIALLSYRIVSLKEMQSVQDTGRAGRLLDRHTLKANLDSLSRELQPLLNLIKSSSQNVAQYLATLDKKINILSEYILVNDEDENDIDPQQINIGAGGLSFVSEKAVMVGAMIELQLKLLPEKRGIFSYARVVSSHSTSQQPCSDKPSFKIAVEFEFMDDEVRDIIMHHVLNKERSLLNKATSDLAS